MIDEPNVFKADVALMKSTSISLGHSGKFMLEAESSLGFGYKKKMVMSIAKEAKSPASMDRQSLIKVALTKEARFTVSEI